MFPNSWGNNGMSILFGGASKSTFNFAGRFMYNNTKEKKVYFIKMAKEIGRDFRCQSRCIFLVLSYKPE